MYVQLGAYIHDNDTSVGLQATMQVMQVTMQVRKLAQARTLVLATGDLPKAGLVWQQEHKVYNTRRHSCAKLSSGLQLVMYN